jgi:anti-sigma factor RsiW
MTDKTCKSIDELLVAYSDDQLSALDVGRVEAHLAGCPDCREEFRALEQSLEIAQSLWRQSAENANVPKISPAGRSRRKLRPAVCVAACLVLAAMATVSYVCLSRGNPAAVEVADPIVPPSVTPDHVEKPVLGNEEIEAVIARQGRIARLRVSAQLLAAQPGLEVYRDRAERYLAETYGVSTLDGPEENRPAEM